MHVGSNPTARTSQSQSPRSPYRGAGRLFLYQVRRLDNFLSVPMICGSSSPIPPRLSNRDIRLPPHQSPCLPYCFPSPTPRIVLFDSPCRTPIRLGGKQRPSRLPPCIPFSIGGEARPRSPPRFPIRPIGFSPSSSPRFPSGGSVSPLFRADELGECVFFARISVFPVDFAAACDTLNRYTCGRGGTADTPDLGSGGEIRVGSNPTARTTATYSPPPQPVQVAAGRAFPCRRN